MIDTRVKRESATKILCPWYAQTITPTGTLDRIGAIWLYNGIGAAEVVVSIVHALTWALKSTKTFLKSLMSTKTLAIEVESTKTLEL